MSNPAFADDGKFAEVDVQGDPGGAIGSLRATFVFDKSHDNHWQDTYRACTAVGKGGVANSKRVEGAASFVVYCG